MIFFIIGILILLYSFLNYKKGFMCYVLFQVFWFPNAKLLLDNTYFNNLPAIPLSLVLSFSFAILYIFKSNSVRAHTCSYSFPLLIPFTLLVVSRFLTCYSSLEGFNAEFARLLGFFFSQVFDIYLIWKIIDSKEDYVFMAKGLTLIFIIAGVYGIVEVSLSKHLLLDYKNMLTPEGISVYSNDAFRGFRLYSVFEHPIGAGINFSLYIIFVLSWLFLFDDKLTLKPLVIITAIVAIICIILTRMRSGILFLLIALVIFINNRSNKTYRLLLGATFLLIITSPLYADQLDVLWSIFDESARQKVGGSNLDMRLNQLNASMEIMSESPAFGLGEQVSKLYHGIWRADALEFESFVFEEMTHHGIVGLLSTLILIIFSIIIVPRKFHSREAAILAISLWVTHLMTSVPSLRMSLYYFVYFYFCKQAYINSKDYCDNADEYT